MTPNCPWRSRGGSLVVKSAPDLPELVLEARPRPVRRLAARSVSAPQNFPLCWVLIPLRAVPGQLGLMPRLVQTLGRLRPPLACPRLPVLAFVLGTHPELLAEVSDVLRQLRCSAS